MPQPFETILITGATGSWGNAATQFLLDHTSATIRCFSRDWVKQADMAERFQHNDRLRFLLGDVHDFRRLQVAMDGVDLVFHAAALKQVTAGEYNITEVTKTNIVGTELVIRAARDMGVKKMVFLSSDKACLPWNSYGLSKAYSERTVTQANGYAPHKTEYCCVRYGNVHASRGSVGELWTKALREGRPLKITDMRMSRFFLTIQEAICVAWSAACMAPRGGIFIPHLPAYTLKDLAVALASLHHATDVAYETIGVRQGEKWHENLMAPDEESRLAIYAQDGGTPLYYCVMPASPTWEIPPIQGWSVQGRIPVANGKTQATYGRWHKGGIDQPYNSGTWPYRLGAMDLQRRLAEEAP